MAAITQQVIVEFVVEDSQVQTAAQKLQATGKIDNQLASSFKATTAEINKQAQAVRNISVPFAPLKKNFEDTNKSAKNFAAFMEGFAEGIMDELNKAGITLEEFLQKLVQGPKEAETGAKSLKAQLRELTQQIQQLKLAGQDDTEQFRELVKEAGRVKDAINDAGQEIKDFASDTQTLDNILGSVQALTGAFAAWQGVTALVGDEDEDLQKTLVKVNASLAVLQGFQAIVNALQKEGAIIQLGNTIATKGAALAMQLYNFVVGESIGLLRLFRIALAATGIGLLVFGVIELINALKSMGSQTKQSIKDLQKLNAEFDRDTQALDNYVTSVRQAGDELVTALETQNAKDKDVRSQRLKNMQAELQAIIETESQYRDEFNKRLQLLKDVATGQRKFNEEEVDEAEKFVNKYKQLQQQRADVASKIRIQIEENDRKSREEILKGNIASLETLLSKQRQGSESQLKIQKQLVNARLALELNTGSLVEQERTAAIEKANKERLQLEVDFNKRKLELQISNIDAQLVNVEEGSKQEFDLRIKQLRLQAQAETSSLTLSEAEKKAIREKSLQEQLKLQKEFNERIRKEAIDAQISLNNAQLDQLKTNDEDRLLLQISNIELAAQLEIDAAKNNGAKIKEITSKRDADILAAKKQFLEAQLDFELSLEGARRGSELRALQRTSQDQRKSFDVRKAAISQITAIEVEEVDKRLAVLEDEKNKKLISEKDYQLKYAQLQDQKKKIIEDNEQSITELTKQQNQLRIQTTIQAFQAIGNGASQLSQALTENNNLRISEEKDKVKALLDAGAITEKEANNRNKRIEAEERRLNREAAQRDKAIGIFQAVINTADAVTKALASAPPPFNVILAGIAGALGAVQIGVIANRPLPKLRKGKNRWSAFEGLAEVGEAGTELVEKDGKKYLVDKSTVMYIGKKDIVYTPEETNKILMPQPDKRALNHNIAAKEKEFDYDKMADAIAGKIKNQHTNINIDEDGFHVSVDDGISRKNYMDRRYSSKT